MANPCNLLQTLVDKAMDLCRAGTAGISVLTTDTDGEYLAGEALSGVYAPISGAVPPLLQPLRHDARSERSPALLTPARYFTYFAQADVPIVEGLVIPVYVSGRPTARCGS